MNVGFTEEDIEELGASGGFSFWDFLMGVIEDVVEYYEENGGSGYEEYDDGSSAGGEGNGKAKGLTEEFGFGNNTDPDLGNGNGK